MLPDTTLWTPPRTDCHRKVADPSRSPPKLTESVPLNRGSLQASFQDFSTFVITIICGRTEKGQILMAYARTLILSPELIDWPWLFLWVCTCAPRGSTSVICIWAGVRPERLDSNNRVDWLPAGSKTALWILLSDNGGGEMDVVCLRHSFIIGSMEMWKLPTSMFLEKSNESNMTL